MISSGVEISMARGGGEMVCALSLDRFFFDIMRYLF